MPGYAPGAPFLDRASVVAAWGTGFSAMLRSRAFNKQAKLLPAAKFGSVFPMADREPLGVADALARLDWLVRNRGAGPLAEDPESDRQRRRGKRALQQARLFVLTFAARAGDAPSPPDVTRDLRKISALLKTYAPELHLMIALDPAPFFDGSGGKTASLTAAIGAACALRAGIEPYLASEGDLNTRCFYFPAFELTLDFATVAPAPAPLIDVFCSYFLQGGPDIASATRSVHAGRLKALAKIRRGAVTEAAGKAMAA